MLGSYRQHQACLQGCAELKSVKAVHCCNPPPKTSKVCARRRRPGKLCIESSMSLVEVPTRSVLGLDRPEARPFEPVVHPAAWYAADWKGRDDEWTYRLTAQDLEEVDAAVKQVLEKFGGPHPDMTQADFPLPTLGPKLVGFRDEVVLGRGFQLIKGIPVDRYSLTEVASAYFGFGTYWGKAVSQNAKHHLLGHVKDINLPGGHKNPVNRVYATHGAQPWHVDQADFVGLLCVKTAKSGGLSSWASSLTVHNELLKARPDLVRVFTEPFYVDRKDEVPAGKLPWFTMPVFNYYEGHLTVYYENGFFQSCERHHPKVPKLTPQQLEAIAEFDRLAGSDDLRMDYVLEPGDVQLLTNHAIAHTRSEYVDHEEWDKKRHLMRLWVAPENDRPLPPQLAERYGSVEIGNRGGIVVDGTTPRVPVDAE